MSRWTLKTTTWSGSVVATAWMKSPSSGDGKRSGDMSSRRSVMLWVSISSVMMVTRSAHWAVTLCTPSDTSTLMMASRGRLLSSARLSFSSPVEALSRTRLSSFPRSKL